MQRAAYLVLVVVVVSVLLKMLAPSGEMQSMFKTATALFVISGVLAGLLNLKGIQLNIFAGDSSSLSEEYTYTQQVQQLAAEYLKDDIEQLLKEEKIEFEEVKVAFHIDSEGSIQLKQVQVYSNQDAEKITSLLQDKLQITAQVINDA